MPRVCVDKQTGTTAATKKYVDNGYLIWYRMPKGLAACGKPSINARNTAKPKRNPQCKPPRHSQTSQLANPAKRGQPAASDRRLILHRVPHSQTPGAPSSARTCFAVRLTGPNHAGVPHPHRVLVFSVRVGNLNSQPALLHGDRIWRATPASDLSRSAPHPIHPGCPTLTASLFLRLGWETSTLNRPFSAGIGSGAPPLPPFPTRAL